MIEFEKGKIYSFVGPAGGGKSYSANKICKESEYWGDKILKKMLIFKLVILKK